MLIHFFAVWGALTSIFVKIEKQAYEVGQRLYCDGFLLMAIHCDKVQIVNSCTILCRCSPIP